MVIGARTTSDGGKLLTERDSKITDGLDTDALSEVNSLIAKYEKLGKSIVAKLDQKTSRRGRTAGLIALGLTLEFAWKDLPASAQKIVQGALDKHTRENTKTNAARALQNLAAKETAVSVSKVIEQFKNETKSVDLPKPEKKPKNKPKTPANIAAEKTFLTVPIEEKDEAKQLGANWDPSAKSWYVKMGTPLDKFVKWLPPQKS
jgi:hypothetical protein